jgi:hypothetical protein
MPPTLSAPLPAAAAPAAPATPSPAATTAKTAFPTPSIKVTETGPSKEKSDESPSWMDGIGQELDGMADERPKTIEKPKTKAAEKPVVEPKETKEPEEPTEPAEPSAPVKPVKAAELRNAYETLKKERKEVLEPKIQQLEAKLKELETKSPESIKPIEDKLAALEKRNQELEQEIEFQEFRKSDKYVKNYEQPFKDKWFRTVATLSELEVIDMVPDGLDENDQPKFREVTRPGTADDLQELAYMPLGKRIKKAKQMFGDGYETALAQIREVEEASRAMNAALEDAKKNGLERKKQTQAQAELARKKQNELWSQYNKDLAERFPKVFGPEEGDEEGNTLLQKGFAHADRLFLPTEETKPKTIEEMVQLHTILRNKIANHDRLLLRNKRLATELAETKKALEEYEKSTPPAGKAGAKGAAPKSFEQELDEEIRAMDKP